MASNKEKLIKIINNVLSEEEIDCIYNEHILNKKNNIIKKKDKALDKEVKKKPIKIIDKSTSKYKILLKFINKILVNIDKDEIDDLTDFKNIDRLDIIKPKNKEILDKMAHRLYKYFAKKSNFYRKTPSIVLIIIRGLCKQIGLRFVSKQRETGERINNKYYRRTHMFYSIKNI